ncbi:hypothetical protein GURKE_00960 [Brevundimonas phage vB_BpoS-Gurke]|uniref:Uncharacterized protein n=1 Tax=Brevundimonas phage vB_BpoS-Gurke TaxID=2948599 RepID=A0A9E7N422_9CAUD|nr:hypothetical protein GURKE_00960 [Brevundimonas phage vB_BpoS-Gurke]
MERLLVVDFCVRVVIDDEGLAEGERRIAAALETEAELTLDGAVARLAHAYPWATAALEEWVERNRAFTARALERRPWEEGLHVTAVVYDRCFAGGYGLDATQDGTDVYSHLDPIETPLMTIHYLFEQSAQEHRTLAEFVVNAMNDAWRKENGPAW